MPTPGDTANDDAIIGGPDAKVQTPKEKLGKIIEELKDTLYGPVDPVQDKVIEKLERFRDHKKN